MEKKLKISKMLKIYAAPDLMDMGKKENLATSCFAIMLTEMIGGHTVDSIINPSITFLINFKGMLEPIPAVLG